MPEVRARKVKRKEVRFDRYTEKLAEALMATGDFANEADMIRLAIQKLHAEYAAHLVHLVLQSRNMSIDTGLVAKLGEQKPVTVTRRKSRKSKAASKPEEEESVEAI